MHFVDKINDLKFFKNQRHLAFGSPKLRLVTSIAERARRYANSRDVTDKESNIARKGRRAFPATLYGKFINYSFSTENFRTFELAS